MHKSATKELFPPKKHSCWPQTIYKIQTPKKK